MAGRRTLGAAGCLAGAAVAVVVWVAAWLTFHGLGTLGWVLVAVLGLMAGGVPNWLLSEGRDRRWVQDVLLPEADRAGVAPGWVLAVVEGTEALKGTGDELGALRDIGPVLRAELAAGGGAPEGEVAGFGPPPGVILCPGCGAKVRMPVDRGPLAIRRRSCLRGVPGPRGRAGQGEEGASGHEIRKRADRTEAGGHSLKFVPRALSAGSSNPGVTRRAGARV